jgi:hypothetical protein
MRYKELEMSPTEDFPFEVNFGVGDWEALFDSDPIDPAACTVKNWQDGAVAVGLTLGTPAVSDKVIQFRVTPSAVGSYQLKVKAVSTTNDYDAEEFLLLHVRLPTVP